MMTNADLLMLFNKSQEDARWLTSVDSAEFLAVVTYLVADPFKVRH